MNKSFITNENFYFLLSLVLSLTILSLSYTIENENLLLKRQHQMHDYTSSIIKEVELNVQVLHLMSSVFKIKNDLTRLEFHNLAHPLLTKYVSIQALEWIPKVLHSQRSTYEKEAQKVYPHFSFKERTHEGIVISDDKDVYYPVYYVEPYLNNEAALGYDLSSSKIRFATLSTSIEENSILATAKITLVQSSASEPAFLVFSPIFNTLDNFIGFTLGVFKIKPIMNFPSRNDSIKNFTLHDEDAQLLISQGTLSASSYLSKSIHIFDRKWQLKVDFHYSTIYTYPISIFIFLFLALTYTLLVYYLRRKSLEKIFLQKKVTEAVAQLHENDIMLLQQSRLAQMGELISMIAHQWRQPLSTIAALSYNIQLKIQLGLFQAKDKEQNEKFINDNLALIDNCTQNLSCIIDDFRNFYKQDQDFVDSTYEKVVTKSLVIMQHSLEADSITILYDYKNIKTLTMNENQVIQVVLSLLKNAQDNFLAYKIKEPQITFIIDQDKLSIRDNGSGLSPDVLEKIFDPYFSTKNEKNSMGLGLYMSKTIINKQHKGDIYATNTKNGMEFTIELGLDKLP